MPVHCNLHVIQIPSAKKNSALSAAIWVDFMEFGAVAFIIRSLAIKPSLVTAKSQLPSGRPSKVITKVLLFL